MLTVQMRRRFDDDGTLQPKFQLFHVLELSKSNLTPATPFPTPLTKMRAFLARLGGDAQHNVEGMPAFPPGISFDLGPLV